MIRPLALAAVGLAATATGLGSLALPASAAPAAPNGPSPSFAHGRVIAAGGVATRSLPTTASTNYGSYPHGQRLTLLCKVRGTSVSGNRLWYLVPAEGWEFVSARWVADLGAAPGYCGSPDDAAGRTTATVNTRSAPTTAFATTGTLPKATRIAIRCSVEGPSVAGNRHWYYLRDHRWVSTRSVHLTGNAPTPCYPPWAG